MALRLESDKMIKRIAIGALLGGLFGYLYYYFVGCYSGTCAITSNPVNSTVYGAILGGLVIELLSDLKQLIGKRFHGATGPKDDTE